jgi:stearoyl-CoA desaturase (delta-9 desaturase)
MMRVGVLHGGMPHALEEQAVPPSQHLRVTRFDEMTTTRGPAAGMENGSVAA